MTMIFIFVFIILGLFSPSSSTSCEPTSFPTDFKFGAATAAYQIEGAWNIDGKGPSMWDHLVRTDPDHIADSSSGDIAANSYYNYKRDIEMLIELGVDSYRFSISWPRILPNGRPDNINDLGVEYYNNLIDELIRNGITPFVTMYHWDLPQTLSEEGGWLNEDIVDWFGDYARVLYTLFGDRVKHWLTVNEPYVHCKFSYESGAHAPRIQLSGVGYYECGRNYILAHARAYHIYDEEFRTTQQGEVGIVISMSWGMIEEETDENLEALLDYRAFEVHMFLKPILSIEGNFPERVIERVAANSFAEGYNSSRLRHYTPQEVDYIKGSADFIGVNHYTSSYLYRNQSLAGLFEVPSNDNDRYSATYFDPAWPVAASYWGSEYAPGFYSLLLHIRDTYPGVKLYITENGMGSQTGLNDITRANYVRNYLTALSEAIAEGVNVQGYFVWSLMDNFEWANGYTVRFGIYEVDMDDPKRTRTPRISAFVYQNIVRNKAVDPSFQPELYAEDSASGVKAGSFLVANALLIILLQ